MKALFASNVLKNFCSTGIPQQSLRLFGILLLPASLSAQSLEEVIVTAQKREQNLQDVPISIATLSGDSMRSAGISRLEDMSGAVPNFSFTEAVSGSDNMFMRGVGSGINYGFEQAVGQVIDGFFYGRSRFGRAAFLDVERVEILKGPQGALIGKNTSAGAINITTAKPTEEFEMWAAGTWEFEGSEGFNFEGAVSGPLSERLRGRVALRYDEREGYVKNVAADRHEQSLDDFTIRATLVWDILDTLDATLSYQHGDFDRSGRTTQLSQCGQALRNFDPDGPGPAPAGALFNALVAAGEDCTANYEHNVVLTKHGQPVDQAYDTQFDTVGLTLNWEILGGHTLTSLTGYSAYDSVDDFEVDFTFAPIAAAFTTEDYEQWSQELRLTSPVGDRFDYIAGAYLQFNDHDVSFRRDFIALPPPLTPSGNVIATAQESDTYALFAQFTRHITDAWDLTVSGRYTHEEKDATQMQTPTLLHTNTPTVLVPPAGPAASIHDIAGKRTENNFSPTANLQWRPNDDAMLYGSIARGFKGGGFDMQNDGVQALAAESFEFEDEDVTAYELGAKLSLLDGAAQLNIALFRSEFDNLQVSTINSVTTTFNVGNAASAISQGLEADLKWAATETLTFSAAFAYLDSEYDEFPDAPCNFVLIAGGGCTGANQTTDLSGRELPFAPEISATVSGEYVWSVGRGFEITAYAQVVYSDEFALVLDLDPNAYQEEFTKVDARLTLSNPTRTWEISLIGRNLTDELTRSFANDGLGGPFMAGSYFSMVDAPRSIAVQGLVRF
jgi:outer membrane receptor protein involved in Fe transport